MHQHMYIYVYTPAHVYIFLCTSTICMFIYNYMCVYVYANHMHICLYISTYMYMFMHKHMCVYVYAKHICFYVYAKHMRMGLWSRKGTMRGQRAQEQWNCCDVYAEGGAVAGGRWQRGRARTPGKATKRTAKRNGNVCMKQHHETPYLCIILKPDFEDVLVETVVRHVFRFEVIMRQRLWNFNVGLCHK